MASSQDNPIHVCLCVCVFVSLCVCVCVRSHVVLVWRKQNYVVLLAEIGFLAAAPLGCYCCRHIVAF